MTYTISYYSEAVEDQVLSLPDGLLARYFSLTDRMIEVGANLGEPHTEAFGGGLFELRLKSKEGIARVFYQLRRKTPFFSCERHCRAR